MVRHYDIDWLRVIAIALLLVYHVAICFQPWAPMLGFISSGKPWLSLWLPMTMLNIWRIPLLFFVSGMGVYLAMKNRPVVELLKERALRILIPFLFGAVAIVPLHILIWRYHNGLTPGYGVDSGHLWFLWNIACYVVLLSPLFYLIRRNQSGKTVENMQKFFARPWGLLLVWSLFIAEVLLLNPIPYELYAKTTHGFVVGLLAFASGFLFMLSGEGFFTLITKIKWFLLAIAIGLFAIRVSGLPNIPFAPVRLVIESQAWITCALAFGHSYLRRPGRTLRYLSLAAYPVYIMHMVFLFLGGTLTFKLDIDVRLQFVLLLSFTLVGCLAFFEFVIRRIGIVGVLFGYKAPRTKGVYAPPNGELAVTESESHN